MLLDVCGCRWLQLVRMVVVGCSWLLLIDSDCYLIASCLMSDLRLCFVVCVLLIVLFVVVLFCFVFV